MQNMQKNFSSMHKDLSQINSWFMASIHGFPEAA